MKALSKTKSTVRLKKSDYQPHWLVYIESYPVFIEGISQPQRVREYLNRSVTSVVWDKKHTARTTETSKSFKPKRDENGLIVCKSEADRETILYADGVRKLRQREYDNADLYNETEAAQAELKKRTQQNAIEYFVELVKKRHANNSNSVRVNWSRTVDLIKLFAGENLPFSKIDSRFVENFKNFLLTAPNGKKKAGTISQNTAVIYFIIFKSMLKQAFIDDFLKIDLSGKTKGIKKRETRREYLTIEELNKLADTPCKHEIIKNAALFSALTGLRHSDIKKMKWSEILIENSKARLNFTQQKTKGVEYMPISPQALKLCGQQKQPDSLVFVDLPGSKMSLSYALQVWLKNAGIKKKITFHCFRHTFATLQLAGGTDIYTVSKMLGHTDVKTTQIYAKVVDEKKDLAANAIKLNINN